MQAVSLRIQTVVQATTEPIKQLCSAIAANSSKLELGRESGAVQKCSNLVEFEKCYKKDTYYLLAKIGFNTAENEPAKVWQTYM